MCDKVLVVGHRPSPRPGRLGASLVARGFELDVRSPMAGDPLPDDLARYRAIVVLGGPMSANDSIPALGDELSLIERALTKDRPFLGICLGAQLMARALGARVAPHPRFEAEIGYFPVRATPAGNELFDMEHYVYQWHTEGFDLPSGSTLLATGEIFENQAISHGPNAYGIQFHPEVTSQMMDDWLGDELPACKLARAQDAAAQRLLHRYHHRPLGQWLERFVDNWLGQSASQRNHASLAGA